MSKVTVTNWSEFPIFAEGAYSNTIFQSGTNRVPGHLAKGDVEGSVIRVLTNARSS